jgi:hypothetical protein
VRHIVLPGNISNGLGIRQDVLDGLQGWGLHKDHLGDTVGLQLLHHATQVLCKCLGGYPGFLDVLLRCKEFIGAKGQHDECNLAKSILALGAG